MTLKRKCVTLLLSIFVLTGTAASLTIKIGSVAPENTPWDKALRRVGAEWAKVTEGKVKFNIISVPLTERYMIKRLSKGEIDGAAVANNGLICLYRDVFALNIPLLFTSAEEFRYVFEKTKPFLEQKIENKGYKMIIWMLIGWLKFFTKEPVFYPDDLRDHKLSVDTGDQERNEIIEKAWEEAGYKIVRSDFLKLKANLDLGRVNAFYLPPVLAIQGHYFPHAPNLCPLRVAPVLGGIVFSRETWDTIPEQYKDRIMEAAKRVSANLYEEIEQKENEAVKKMRKQDLIVNELPPSAHEKWYEESKRIIEPLVGKIFSKEIYEQIQFYLKEYRESGNEN